MTLDLPTSSTDTHIGSWLDEHGEDLVAMRRNLHAHPELSGLEFATTDLVAERLELAGLSPTRLSSGTGLICDIPGEHPDRPMFAMRADLDALGMQDEKDVPYRSQVPGVCHACGHDAHTVIVLGAALYFAHHPELLPGPLRFIFQPAEEVVPGGALNVLADDGLKGVGAVVGVHCDPKLDVGLVGLRPGAISSAADKACVTLSGPGGHTARPELTVDMVSLAASVISALPVMVADAIGDAAQVKMVFGAVHAGDAANVIPAHCELQASIRTPSPETWERLPKVVDAALHELLANSGASYDLDYTHGVPPVINDPGVTEVIRAAAITGLGAQAVVDTAQSWGGDDFAWYLRERPGTYVRLGVHDPDSDGPRLDLHAGRFDVDERSIGCGVKLMVASAHGFFAANNSRPSS